MGRRRGPPAAGPRAPHSGRSSKAGARLGSGFVRMGLQRHDGRCADHTREAVLSQLPGRLGHASQGRHRLPHGAVARQLDDLRRHDQAGPRALLRDVPGDALEEGAVQRRPAGQPGNGLRCFRRRGTLARERDPRWVGEHVGRGRPGGLFGERVGAHDVIVELGPPRQADLRAQALARAFGKLGIQLDAEHGVTCQPDVVRVSLQPRTEQGSVAARRVEHARRCVARPSKLETVRELVGESGRREDDTGASHAPWSTTAARRLR